MSTLGIHICKYMFKKCLLKLFHYKHIFIPENLENAKKEKEGSFAHPSLPFAFSSHRPNTVISQQGLKFIVVSLHCWIKLYTVLLSLELIIILIFLFLQFFQKKFFLNTADLSNKNCLKTLLWFFPNAQTNYTIHQPCESLPSPLAFLCSLSVKWGWNNGQDLFQLPGNCTEMLAFLQNSNKSFCLINSQVYILLNEQFCFFQQRLVINYSRIEIVMWFYSECLYALIDLNS